MTSCPILREIREISSELRLARQSGTCFTNHEEAADERGQHQRHEGVKQLSGKDQYQRIRDDHATELAEDYVEAIAEVIDENDVCRVTDLAEHFGVSHVTVIRAVRRFERDGLVKVEQNEPIELTQRGAELADACLRRHQIVYEFLLALGVAEKTAAADAEGIEHHVSSETLKHMTRFVRQRKQEQTS